MPFPTVPKLIRKFSVVITIYNLYCESVPDFWVERYKRIVDMLEKISKGEITVGVGPAPEENPAQSAAKSTKDRVFSRESMSDW